MVTFKLGVLMVVIKTGASVSNWTFALLKFSVFTPLKAADFLHGI